MFDLPPPGSARPLSERAPLTSRLEPKNWMCFQRKNLSTLILTGDEMLEPPPRHFVVFVHSLKVCVLFPLDM